MALGQAATGEGSEAVEALVTLTRDPVDEVRAQALEGLTEQRLAGANVPNEHVEKALTDCAPCVRCVAVDASALFFDAPGQVLKKAIGDPDPSVRAAAAASLGELGAVEMADELTRLLDDPIEYVVQEAAFALAALGDSAGIEVLIGCLDAGGGESIDAALALGRLGKNEAAEALERTARRTFAPMEQKAMAAAALVRCQDATGLDILKKLLGARRRSVRMTTLVALAQLPVRGLDALLGEIARGNNDLEASAASEILKMLEAS